MLELGRWGCFGCKDITLTTLSAVCGNEEGVVDSGRKGSFPRNTDDDVVSYRYEANNPSPRSSRSPARSKVFPKISICGQKKVIWSKRGTLKENMKEKMYHMDSGQKQAIARVEVFGQYHHLPNALFPKKVQGIRPFCPLLFSNERKTGQLPVFVAHITQHLVLEFGRSGNY